MSTNRTTIFLVCLVYLVGLAFLLNAMSETIVLNYETTSQSIGFSINFLGMEIGLGDSFLGNIVLSIAVLPIAVNTIFIVIPSVLLIVFGIAQFIPTIPSG